MPTAASEVKDEKKADAEKDPKKASRLVSALLRSTNSDHPLCQVKSSLRTERFEDLAENSVRVTIGRVQQVAIKTLGGRVPTPAEQLDLIAQRRVKKGGKKKATSLCMI